MLCIQVTEYKIAITELHISDRLKEIKRGERLIIGPEFPDD